MVQGHGALVRLQDGQACPWVGFGVHYSQETVLHLNFHDLELGILVGAVWCSDTFCHLLLELHRTLVWDDLCLPSVASALWNWSRVAFAPLNRDVVPSFHC